MCLTFPLGRAGSHPPLGPFPSSQRSVSQPTVPNHFVLRPRECSGRAAESSGGRCARFSASGFQRDARFPFWGAGRAPLHERCGREGTGWVYTGDHVGWRSRLRKGPPRFFRSEDGFPSLTSLMAAITGRDDTSCCGLNV